VLFSLHVLSSLLSNFLKHKESIYSRIVVFVSSSRTLGLLHPVFAPRVMKLSADVVGSGTLHTSLFPAECWTLVFIWKLNVVKCSKQLGP
jgi:hypothetical protein